MRTPRGFKYVLEPLRVKGEWDLVEVQVRLAGCNSAVDGMSDQVTTLAGKVDAECAASRATGSRDALSVEVQHMRHAYLGLLSHRLESARQDLGRLEQQRRDVAHQATQLQRFNDGIARHRDEQVKAHLQGQANKAGNEADDAWVRRRHRDKHSTRSDAS